MRKERRCKTVRNNHISSNFRNVYKMATQRNASNSRTQPPRNIGGELKPREENERCVWGGVECAFVNPGEKNFLFVAELGINILVDKAEPRELSNCIN